MSKLVFGNINFAAGSLLALLTGDNMLRLLGGICTLMAIVSYYYTIKEKRASSRQRKQADATKDK